MITIYPGIKTTPCLEAAAMVAESYGATITAACLKQQSPLYAELINAAREVEADAAVLGMGTSRLTAALAALDA